MIKTITRGIVIEQKHIKWIEENSINLSSWIRKKIEEEITKKE